VNCDNTLGLFSPLGLTNGAGLAEAGLRGRLNQRHRGAIRYMAISHQRRGHAHLETNDEMPETDIGALRRDRDRDGHRVSRFGVRPRAVSGLSVLTLALGSSDDDRSIAPFFPLSPLSFLVSDAVPILKKARSSAFRLRSPEKDDHRPALSLFPPTLPSPILSFSPLLFAPRHSNPSP
jgi:hypothetical protein